MKKKPGAPIHWKHKTALFATDALILLVAVYASMLMRFAPIIPEGIVSETTRYLPFLLLSYLGVFLLFRVYGISWHSAEPKQLAHLALSNIVGCGVTLLWNALGNCGLSLYFLLILFMLSLAGTIGNRLGLRLVSDFLTARRGETVSDRHRLLIVGAGKAGRYAASLLSQKQTELGKPVAFADDDVQKQGKTIEGARVDGSVSQLAELVQKHGVTDILIAIPSVRGDRLREIITAARSTKSHVHLLSDPQKVERDYLENKLFTREPDVSDFLTRPEIRADAAKIRERIEGQTLLIAGGGCSVGLEICRQACAYSPAQVIIYDIYENHACELQAELRQKYGDACPVHIVIGSVRDKARLSEVMRLYQPSLVVNASAYRRVALMEQNASEAVRTNVLGARNLMEAAREAGCRLYVQLSSDKAVNPINVVGATRRAAELLTLSESLVGGMNCAIVRIGNILSSGEDSFSLFVSQIRRGGPVTLTHENSERYFATLPEAASLFWQSVAMGENGGLYLPDLGSPIKIRDLANKLILFFGLTPGEDIPVEVIGLRPGEKIYDELFTSDEALLMRPTDSDRIQYIPSAQADLSGVDGGLRALTAAVNGGSEEEVLCALQSFIPFDRRKAENA